MMRWRGFPSKAVAIFTVCAAGHALSPISTFGQTTLVSDPFTDGDRNDGVDSLDAQWWRTKVDPEFTGTDTFVITVADDSAGIGAGNALFAETVGTTAGSRPMVAILPRDIRLVTPRPNGAATGGDYVSVRFQFRITNSPIPDSDRGFRFGLYHDRCTPITEDKDQTAGSDDDIGYFVRLSTGPSANPQFISASITKDKGTSSLLGGSDIANLVTASSFGPILDNNVHTAKLVLTLKEEVSGTSGRNFNVLLTDFVIDEGTANEKWIQDDDRALDTGTTRFNEVAIASFSNGIDYVIDNVVVEFKGCGDGTVTAPEQCDVAAETGTCDEDCTLIFCGDGDVNEVAGEGCDDGGRCNDLTACTQCRDGSTCSTTTNRCLDGTSCQPCLDASSCTRQNGDGCSSTCTVENTWQCTACAGERSTCDGICGDGLVVGTEQCDTGGESATCDDDCTLPVCGDGNHNALAGEACDDGNTVGGDLCSADCRVAIPTVSEWGLAILALLVLTAGTILMGWRRPGVANGS